MYSELRYRHHWILGQTGTGKTTLHTTSVLEDIENNHGVLFIDPHGTATDTILKHFPKRRRDDLIILDLSDDKYPIAWNPLEVGDAQTATLFTETLKAIWGYHGQSTPRLDQTLFNAAVAMQDYDQGNMLGLMFMLFNKEYRERILTHVKDPVVVAYWQHFETLSERDKFEVVGSTLNKVQMLMADSRLRNVLGQVKSAFDLKTILERQQVLLVRLPLHEFGSQKIGAIGSLLLNQLYLVSGGNTKPFHVHIDDVQYFQSPVLSTLLANIGHNYVSLTVNNQFLGQLTPEALASFLGNIGRMTIFRLGIADARFMQAELETDNLQYFLSELPPYWARLVSPAGTSEKHYEKPIFTKGEMIDSPERLVNLSRRTYAKQAKDVEPVINSFVGGLL